MRYSSWWRFSDSNAERSPKLVLRVQLQRPPNTVRGRRTLSGLIDMLLVTFLDIGEVLYLMTFRQRF